MTLDSIIWIM